MATNDIVTESTEQAWKEFRSALADRIFAHDESDHVLWEVDVPERHQTPTGPYVQVGWSGDEITAEVSSNRVIDPKFRLTKELRSRLREAGWNRPDNEHVNYWIDVDAAYADQAADMLIAALRDAFGIVHPAFLIDRFREETTPGAEDDAVEQTHILDRAEPVDGPDDLNAMVDIALGSDIGRPTPTRDDDGDLPYLCDSAVVFVRVMRDRPAILLFCELVVNVTDPKAAAFEVAVLNRDHPAVKFVLSGTRVIMCVEIPAQPFVPDHLRSALEGMCELARTLDADLAHRVGGRRFLETTEEAA